MKWTDTLYTSLDGADIEITGQFDGDFCHDSGDRLTPPSDDWDCVCLSYRVYFSQELEPIAVGLAAQAAVDDYCISPAKWNWLSDDYEGDRY